MFKRFLTAAVFSVVLMGAAVAGPFEDGLAAAQRGDFETALTLLQPLAERGHPDAQYIFGLMHAERHSHSGARTPKR